MSDTRTIGICDEVCVIDFMIFLSMFLIIVYWKWGDIPESDELRAFEFSDDRVLAFSLEYCLCTILRDDELLGSSSPAKGLLSLRS